MCPPEECRVFGTRNIYIYIYMQLNIPKLCISSRRGAFVCPSEECRVFRARSSNISLFLVCPPFRILPMVVLECGASPCPLPVCGSVRTFDRLIDLSPLRAAPPRCPLATRCALLALCLVNPKALINLSIHLATASWLLDCPRPRSGPHASRSLLLLAVPLQTGCQLTNPADGGNMTETGVGEPQRRAGRETRDHTTDLKG